MPGTGNFVSTRLTSGAKEERMSSEMSLHDMMYLGASDMVDSSREQVCMVPGWHMTGASAIDRVPLRWMVRTSSCH